MFQDLNIDSDILGVNETYFVSKYITDFNSLEMISASDVNAQTNKSTIADVGVFTLCHPCVIELFSEGNT